MCLWQTYMMTHGTPTATKRKTNSQHPRHSDTGNKSSLFRVARRCAGQWGLVGHAVAFPGDEEAERVALPGAGQQVARDACRTCSHTARNHPYRLSLELRLVSVVHRRIANAEHFLAGEPRTIVVV